MQSRLIPTKRPGKDKRTRPQPLWLHRLDGGGGGVKGGQSVGATDELGFQAVEIRVHHHDLHATTLRLLGYDQERLTYRYAGRDFRLTDVHGRVVPEVIG